VNLISYKDKVKFAL